jgi:hypothetical protein
MAGEPVVPASHLDMAVSQVIALQRVLGKKAIELEILRNVSKIGEPKSR